MPTTEITKLRDDLLWLLSHIVGTLDGLDAPGVNWRPPAKDANSLLVIATHALGAAEAHVIQLLAGQQIERVRANEFTVSGGADPVRARLRDTSSRIAAVLDGLDPAELDRDRSTPGGTVVRPRRPPVSAESRGTALRRRDAHARSRPRRASQSPVGLGSDRRGPRSGFESLRTTAIGESRATTRRSGFAESPSCYPMP